MQARSITRARMLTWLMATSFMATSLMAGCDEDDEAPTTEAEPAPAEAPAVSTRVTLHEWGLISDRLGADELAVLSRAPVPNRNTPPQHREGHSLGSQSLGRGGGKPVVYAHLPAGEAEATFSLTVRPVGGRVVEHWPLVGAVGAPSVTFRDVHVSAEYGLCPRDYPSSEDEPCRSVTDGFCEASTLPTAETGHTCLTLAGAHADHLFYRAVMPRRPLPLEVTVAGDGSVSARNVGGSVLPGHLIRVTGARGRADTRVVFVRPPHPNASVVLPDPATAEPPVNGHAGAAELRTMLAATGLTEHEVQAFAFAWDRELFGRPPPTSTVGLGELTPAPSEDLPPSLERPTTAVLYLMPEELIDEHLRLEASDNVERIRRAIVVRVGLTYGEGSDE